MKNNKVQLILPSAEYKLPFNYNTVHRVMEICHEALLTLTNLNFVLLSAEIQLKCY